MLLCTLAACAREPPPLVTRPAGPPAATLIHDVAVFDGISASSTPGREVLLEDGRITSIRPSGTLPTAGRVLIDGSGMTLIPGLIDMHGHTGQASAPVWAGAWPDPERNLQSYLYCGVTRLLDPADLASEAFERRDAVGRGELLGPHIFAAGPMFTAPGGHPVPVARALAPWWLRWYLLPRMTRQVGTPEEARAAVAALAPSRPDVIKVVVDAVPSDAPVIDPAVLGAVVAAATEHGIRTVAHIGTTADAILAGEQSVAAWMHGVYKERIPDDALERMVQLRIPYVATSAVFENYADVYEGTRHPTVLERETVDPEVLEGFAPLPDDFDIATFREFFALLVATREARRENIRRLFDAGVKILAGSDTQSGIFPGPGLHRELALLVEAGMPPARALRAATSDAARFLFPDVLRPEFGIVAEGLIADLVLVEGDPAQDIAATERIREVFLGGVRLERHPLVSGAR